MPLIVQGTDFVTLPVGTTEQRPTVPEIGMIRVNNTNNLLEVYDGTSWITLVAG